MPKSAVRVAVRTRPTAQFAQDNIIINTEANEIHINQRPSDSHVHNKQDNWTFRVHNLLHNASQEAVYESLARNVVSGILEGINGTIMTYGQTGAGKSFTMVGGTQNYQHRGIAPRALAQLFQEMQSRPEMVYHVYVTFMEIYNERIFDLLDDISNEEQKTDFAIVDERGHGTVVRGLTHEEIQSEEDGLSFLFKGEINRTTAEHQLNKTSNRSHSIFTIHIESHSRVGSAERILRSKLHLVDLAGSERLKKTHSDSKSDDVIKRESMYINKSLTYLEQCVVALTSRGRVHVPFRQSKLTNVLRDSLGGNCRTVLIANIWCEAAHLEETIFTLKMATRMMRVQNDASANFDMDPTELVKKYEREIRELKQELQMHDSLVGRSQIVYDEFTPEQKYEIQQKVKQYIDAPEDEEDNVFELVNIRQIKEIFKQFKCFVQNISAETEMRLRTEYEFVQKEELHDDFVAQGESRDRKNDTQIHFVGEEEDIGGFGVGVSGSGRHPIDISGLNPRLSGTVNHTSKTTEITDEFEQDTIPQDPNEAFHAFKSGPGFELAQEISNEKEELKQKKQLARSLTIQVNNAKSQIDTLRDQLEIKRNDVESYPSTPLVGSDEIVDEEEFRLIKELKEAKKNYRALFEQLKETRQAADNSSSHIDALKSELISQFEQWFGSPIDLSHDHDYHSTTNFRRSPRHDGSDDDKLDEEEQFERLELERAANENPDSIAFFNAKKSLNNSLKRGGETKKRIMIKNKRAIK